MGINELRTMITSARLVMKSPTEWKALSDATRRDYEQRRAALHGRLPMEAATCKRSYYVMKAAFMRMESRALRSCLNELDKWSKVATQKNGGTMEGIVREYMAELHRLGIHERFKRLEAVAKAGPFMGSAKGIIQSTHGKRAVGKLPPHWKTKLLGAVPKIGSLAIVEIRSRVRAGKWRMWP